MKPFAKVVSTILLTFVGFTALYGGWALMIDPTGEILHMPVTYLYLSPFKNYFIPGAILFFILGLGTILILPAVVLGKSNSSIFLILAGVVLNLWIISQVTLLGEINWFHAIYISIAMMLILIGVIFRRVKA